MKAPHGFTLVELLVVVAILALLAAIAVPNFLEAQVRAKSSAAQASERTLATALQMYRVDNNAWPPTESILPHDPLALLCKVQLRRLTTPIAYVEGGAFRDPFGVPRLYSKLQSVPLANPGLVPQDEDMDNDGAGLLYFHFPSTAVRFSIPEVSRDGVAIVSIGPDREDSLGAFAKHPAPLFNLMFSYAGVGDPISTLYDPTNGSVSEGDIVRFVGEGE